MSGEVYRKILATGKAAGKLKRKKRSGLLLWVQEHPGVLLPRSVKEITILTGCSEDQVKTFLSRRRRQTRMILGSLPDLRNMDVEMENLHGQRLHTTQMESYKFIMEHWTAKVSIAAVISGEQHVFQIANLELFTKSISPQTLELLLNSTRHGKNLPRHGTGQTSSHSEVVQIPEPSKASPAQDQHAPVPLHTRSR